MKINVSTYEHFTEIINEATKSHSLIMKYSYELEVNT